MFNELKKEIENCKYCEENPLNKKWIKDHPKFLEERIFEIRKIISATINKFEGSEKNGQSTKLDKHQLGDAHFHKHYSKY